jgi:hypothetical protein
MGGELCFALRCRGSRQRPALRRQCSKCLPGATYVPAMLDIPPHPPQPPSRAPPTNGLSAHVCSEETSLVRIIFGATNRKEVDERETDKGGACPLSIKAPAESLFLFGRPLYEPPINLIRDSK